jgi:hypothetical protein
VRISLALIGVNGVARRWFRKSPHHDKSTPQDFTRRTSQRADARFGGTQENPEFTARAIFFVTPHDLTSVATTYCELARFGTQFNSALLVRTLKNLLQKFIAGRF